MGLMAKKCTPCQGGIPPLTLLQAEKLLVETPGWSLEDNATRIKRTFTFNDFISAMNFAGRVGALAEEEGHHPDITFGWGYCKIEFQTHKIKGLHENDFIMATKVNALV